MAWWEALLVGAGLGFSLAGPPGPILALAARETAAGRWRCGLWVGLGATSGDATHFLIVWLGLLRVIPDPRVLGVMAAFGVVFMDWFAWSAWTGRHAQDLTAAAGSRAGFSAGYALALTSPFNLAWWLGSGATFVSVYGPRLALGFFAAILAWVVVSVWAFHHGARRFARLEHWVSVASAWLLAGFGVVLAYNALALLAS